MYIVSKLISKTNLFKIRGGVTDTMKKLITLILISVILLSFLIIPNIYMNKTIVMNEISYRYEIAEGHVGKDGNNPTGG